MRLLWIVEQILWPYEWPVPELFLLAREAVPHWVIAASD